MAKKKIGIYGDLESTANHKVEDLYIIVDNQSLHFVVKHLISNKYVAFESFVSGTDLNGFSQLLAYLQNNSKLIHAIYKHVHFVMNTQRVLISKSQAIKDHTIYQNELDMVFGVQSDHELLVTPLNEDQVIVSSIPDIYQTLLTRSFPTGKWMHYLNAFVQNTKEAGVFVYFFESYYIVQIRDQDNLIFVRYFEESEEAQNVYNILNACKQCSIVPNNSTLFLRGCQPENKQWVVELGTYFKDAIIEQKEQPHPYYSTYFIF